MSTIKSSNEHLTLNADGSSKDIKFQANGVEKASIRSAGAFTSTTIDATKLTGNLPAISGASLTGLPADATKAPLANPTFTGTVSKSGSSSGTAKIFKTASDASEIYLYIGTGATKFRKQDDSANRMTLTDGGNLQIPKTTDGALGVGTTTAASVLNVNSTEGSSYAVTINCTRSSGSSGHIIDFHENSFAGNRVGTITSSGSSTNYNTSSDYRIKENVDYTWDATTRLKQLKPARFNFIADEDNTLVDGFIAHEVSSIVPEAVSGTKDAMTAEVLYVEGDELPEGKSVGDVKFPEQISPQGIDQSKLVPLLVKTIQELEARIAALEA